ncbi:MAG TPA: VOC family protein [Rhizomicrobium sp.]|jgi:catechol 2,3-dioxygenase-like lactoylglutathione lyase family enzyme
MANSFGTDILIQSPDPKEAALFYVNLLGFEITDETPEMVSLCGANINMFIERGPSLCPILEVMVPNVAEARAKLTANGALVIKDEPEVPRCYVQDPYGLTYNLRGTGS